MQSIERQILEEKAELLREMNIRKARGSFWHYCKVRAPEFYKDGRWHLKLLCDVLQLMYERKLCYEELEARGYLKHFPDIKRGILYLRLMLNMPPRHGKSRTLILFVDWVLGKDATNRILAASYNDSTATDFSRYARDEIIEFDSSNPQEIHYCDIFPNSRMKPGNKSVQQWA